MPPRMSIHVPAMSRSFLFQQVGVNVTEQSVAVVPRPRVDAAERRCTLILLIEQHPPIAHQFRRLFQGVVREEALMTPAVPFADVNSAHSRLEMRVKAHRLDQAGCADTMPTSWFQHAQRFGQEANLLFLREMLDEVFVEYV